MITNNHSWSLGSYPNKSLDPFESPVRRRFQGDHTCFKSAHPRALNPLGRPSSGPFQISNLKSEIQDAFHPRLSDVPCNFSLTPKHLPRMCSSSRPAAQVNIFDVSNCNDLFRPSKKVFNSRVLFRTIPLKNPRNSGNSTITIREANVYNGDTNSWQA